jgi:hypothetical protein
MNLLAICLGEGGSYGGKAWRRCRIRVTRGTTNLWVLRHNWTALSGVNYFFRSLHSQNTVRKSIQRVESHNQAVHHVDIGIL